MLDKIDRRILEALQVDGALSNRELAERVRLSPSASLAPRAGARGSAPWSRGASRWSIAARSAPVASLRSFRSPWDRHTPERFANFEKKVRACPSRCRPGAIWSQARKPDYLLKVVLPDMDHYQEFLLNKVTRIEGVSGVRSSFVMRRVIDTTVLPLGHL